MLNILYTLSIEIDSTWLSSISSMEIDTNRQYIRLLLTLIDFLRSQLFLVLIDTNLLILLLAITNKHYLFPSIPLNPISPNKTGSQEPERKPM